MLFLLSSCYSLLLSNQNQCLFISIPYPMYFSVMVICVCCVMSCTEIVLSQEFFCAKKTCLVANHGSDLWQYVYMYVCMYSVCMCIYIYDVLSCFDECPTSNSPQSWAPQTLKSYEVS